MTCIEMNYEFLDNILTKVYFDLLVWNMLNGFNQNAIYVLCPQNVYQGNE